MGSTLLNYNIIGDRSKPTLIMLHGFLGAAEDWHDVASFLEKDFCSVLINLPGHGCGIDWPKEVSLSFDDIAEDLCELIEEHEIKNPILVGYSLGARIALNAACRFPKRFVGLVLESGSPGIRDVSEREERKAVDSKLAKEMEESGLESFLERWYRLPVFSSLANSPEKLEQLIEKRRQNNPGVVIQVLRELSPGSQRSLWDKLSTLSLPTLLIAGERDNKYRGILSSVAKEISNSSYQIISGAGHFVHFEQMEAFANCVSWFIKTRVFAEQSKANYRTVEKQ